MTAKVSCRASLECWSNVLSSATGCLDLADELIRTVWEWLLLNRSVFLWNHARNARRAEACKAGIINPRVKNAVLSRIQISVLDLPNQSGVLLCNPLLEDNP
jgi:hypothetical protein